MSLHCDDVTRGPHRLQDYLSLFAAFPYFAVLTVTFLC